MRPTISGALFAAAMAAVIVPVDVLFFRGHVWERSRRSSATAADATPLVDRMVRGGDGRLP